MTGAELAEALGAREGLTCVVGAGGKKTTLYRLARELDRAVLTATVRIPIFDRQVARVVTTRDPLAALAAADGAAFPLGLVPEREGEDRYRGYDLGTVADLAAAHDGPVLVKADGARTREFKAPGENEPRIPAAADLVVPVASVAVVGEPLAAERVHRPERVAAVAGVEEGDEVTPAVVARVLASEAGGLKGVPSGATAVPLLNKVDDEAAERVARDVADRLLDAAPVPRVVLASRGDVVDVVS